MPIKVQRCIPCRALNFYLIVLRCLTLSVRNNWQGSIWVNSSVFDPTHQSHHSNAWAQQKPSDSWLVLLVPGSIIGIYSIEFDSIIVEPLEWCSFHYNLTSKQLRYPNTILFSSAACLLWRKIVTLTFCKKGHLTILCRPARQARQAPLTLIKYHSIIFATLLDHCFSWWMVYGNEDNFSLKKTP